MLIGGSGEKVTLKLVAQYGVVCNMATWSRRLPHGNKVGNSIDELDMQEIIAIDSLDGEEMERIY
jgi:hypothetical protein